MIILSIYIGTGNCVNSMEREVQEIRGIVPVIKSWLVFMERRIKICGQNGIDMLSHFDFLSCLSNMENGKERCLYWRTNRCAIVERGGNVLHFKSLYTRRPLHLSVDVNRKFSLYLAFTKLYLCNNKKLSFYCTNYMDIRIGNTSERYTKNLLPWTIISKHASALITVSSHDYSLHIEFEYSIAEKSKHEFAYRYGTYDSRRDYFQMERIHIAVEIIYRIHVEISGCFQCMIIAHDGPHEIFPTILHKTIGSLGFTSFSTSAHYSLVFMTKERLLNTTAIRYNAVLVVYTDVTLRRSTLLVFDNNTRCDENTNQVRSCVFKIRAPGDSNVKLTLMELQIEGIHAGNDFAAGFVIYNVVEGQTEKVSELLESYTYFPVHGIPFTSTDSTMYVVIFAYSVCASIFVQAVTTAERCKGIFVRMDRPTTTAIVHFDNSTNIICFRVQTVLLSRKTGGVKKLSIYIQPNISVLVNLGYAVLYRDKSRCFFNIFENLQDAQWVKSSKKGHQSYIGKIRKLDWDCSPVTKIITTEIQTASCVLPCRLLFRTKGLEHSSFSCNVCRFKYLGGLWSANIVETNINRTLRFDLHIYASHCVTVDLLLCIDPTSRRKVIFVDVNRNQTFSVASQLGVSMHYDPRCMIRLPRHALSAEYGRYSEPQTMREPINLIWDAHLYRIMWSVTFSSWTYTARECQKYGGSLLVIHNQMEFQKIEYLMYKFGVGVLYLGWKRQVSRQQLYTISWITRIRSSLFRISKI